MVKIAAGVFSVVAGLGVRRLRQEPAAPRRITTTGSSFHYYIPARSTPKSSGTSVSTRAAAVAEAELFGAHAKDRKLRNLETNVARQREEPIIESPNADRLKCTKDLATLRGARGERAAARRPGGSTPEVLRGWRAATRTFSEERWAAFKQDIKWFCDHEAPSYWQDMNHDPRLQTRPPVWSMTGHLLSSLAPVSETMLVRAWRRSTSSSWCFAFFANLVGRSAGG